jgi:hypothetical protein
VVGLVFLEGSFRINIDTVGEIGYVELIKFREVMERIISGKIP